jgi:predicted permease
MDLFLASGKAVSTLATIMGAGILWGYYPRPLGLLSPSTVKTLSSLVMWICSPCLLLSIYGRSLTWDLLDNTLSCCAWCCVHVAVSVGVGRLTVGAAAPPAHLAGVYRCAIVFANAASLPFLLLTTLVQRPALRSDPGAFDRGVAYCFSYLIPWWVCIYSIGFEMLKPSVEVVAVGEDQTPAPACVEVSGSKVSSPPVVVPAQPPAPAPALAPLPTAATGAAAVTTTLSFSDVLKRTLQQPPILATLVGVIIGLSPIKLLFWGPAPPLEGVGAVVTVLGQGSIPSANLVLAGSLFATLVELHKDTLGWMGEEALPESAGGWARLTASVSLFYRALQRRLAGDGTRGVQLRDDAEPGGARAAGGAAAVVAQVAVAVDGGAGKAAVVAQEQQQQQQQSAAVMTFFSLRTTAFLIASRLILCPAVSFTLFYLAQAWRVPVLLSNDPMLTLTVLLQAAMPSAQTLLIVSSNVGNDKVGRALSLLFIVMYPLTTVTLLPWLMLAMDWAKV